MIDGISRALVIAAHPYDEVLGCGGTVARLVAEGAEVRSLVLATGAMSRNESSKTEIELLREAGYNAAKTLGTAGVEFCDYPDNSMDTVPHLDVVKSIERVAQDFSPNLVLTHHGNDLNIDHQICNSAVATAFRPLPGANKPAIITFETPSSTEYSIDLTSTFHPNFFVEIEEYLDTKLAALSAYKPEMRPHPHPRSFEQVRDLAVVRGRSVGLAACEAFALARYVAGMDTEKTEGPPSHG